MRKIAIAILLFLCAQAWAEENANPGDYTVKVHVGSSTLDHGFQFLTVVIGGKHYNLVSDIAPNALLALGNYQAKLVKDEHKTSYESHQVYEFLFPDKKTRKFDV